MTGQILPLSPARLAEARAVQPGGIPREPWPAKAGSGATLVAQAATVPAGSAAIPDVVGPVVSRALEGYAAEHDVSVDSRYDQATGRAVVRVADRRTGEVLFESPPEELLRFFASARERPGAPLVVLEA